MLAFRNLAEPGGPGFSEAQAAAVAAEYKIKDLDDQGETIERAGRPADYFPVAVRQRARRHGGQWRRRAARPVDAGQGAHL